MKFAVRTLPLLSAAMLVLAGCSDPVVVTRPADVVGSYAATTWVVTTSASGPVNVLDAGGSVSLTLNEDGTATGSVSIPAGSGLTAVDADLTGSWDLVENRWVLLAPDEASFLAQRFLEVDGRDLRSNAVGIDIVLSRQ